MIANFFTQENLIFLIISCFGIFMNIFRNKRRLQKTNDTKITFIKYVEENKDSLIYSIVFQIIVIVFKDLIPQLHQAGYYLIIGIFFIGYGGTSTIDFILDLGNGVFINFVKNKIGKK